jgi:photosystem II stability/assembly factor-like uncharacterized protein
MQLGLYVGTVGTAMWVSEDHGETWKRPYSPAGLYMESRVWSLTSQPAWGSHVFAGTDRGVYRWHGPTQKWEHIESPLDAFSTYTIAQSPHDPKFMLAGTHPARLYRSSNGGRTWDKLPIELPAECDLIGETRITSILFDSTDAGLIWFGVEIGGVYRSGDGGNTWERTSHGLVSEDIHALAVVRENGKRKLFVATNRGVDVSWDDGSHWAPKAIETPRPYFRAIVPRADTDKVLFLTNGDGPPGSTGRLLRSDDYGETWKDAGLPGILNSTPWCVAVHPMQPNLVFVVTNLGQLFRSEDGGETWVKLKREFGEVRAMILRPLEPKEDLGNL